MTNTTTTTGVATPIKLFITSYQVFGHPNPEIDADHRTFLLKSPTQESANQNAHDQLSNYCTKYEVWDYELYGVDEIVPDTLHYEILGIAEIPSNTEKSKHAFGLEGV